MSASYYESCIFFFSFKIYKGSFSFKNKQKFQTNTHPQYICSSVLIFLNHIFKILISFKLSSYGTFIFKVLACFLYFYPQLIFHRFYCLISLLPYQPIKNVKLIFMLIFNSLLSSMMGYFFYSLSAVIKVKLSVVT